jgi:hypothetical protein
MTQKIFRTAKKAFEMGVRDRLNNPLTDAICFNCKKPLHGGDMKRALDSELPLFCCTYCANEFPWKGDEKEWNKRFAELREMFK